MTGVPVRRRSVAMVYQQFMNYPWLSVYENIASPLRVAKLKPAEIDGASATPPTARPGATARPPAAAISGGQQQRTAIARAIVKGAELVLLDEPLANLDYKLREELREELPRIFSETGAILVYATAEPLEALLLGGNTATLSQGRLIQLGPTLAVYRRPSHLDCGPGLLRPAAQRDRDHKEGDAIRFGDARPMPAAGLLAEVPPGAYTLAFRADAVTLATPWESSLSFAGRVAVDRDQRLRELRPCRDRGRHLRLRRAGGERAAAGPGGEPPCRRHPRLRLRPRRPSGGGRAKRVTGTTLWRASPSTASPTATTRDRAVTPASR